jgi:hypothetical protein
MTDDPLPPLDAEPGPAVPIPPARAHALVAAALDRATQPRGIHRRRRLWAVALAAALVLVIGSALAAWLPRRVRSQPAVIPTSPVTTSLSTAVESSTTPAPMMATSAEPSATAVVVVVPATPLASPADLLRVASEQRTQHQWSDAQATYERIITRTPHTPEAYTATIAAASIRLEHAHDASGALRLYQSALAERPNGSLAEEARWGIAESRRALGDQPGEVEALRAFVAHHPDALMRPSAEARLRELAK